MLEVTKKPRTDGFVELCAVVPAARVDAVVKAMEETAEPNIPAEELFTEMTPGTRLRGARGLMGLTQKQLGELIGALPAYISDMENGRRAIGKAMAKKLGEALHVTWRAFL